MPTNTPIKYTGTADPTRNKFGDMSQIVDRKSDLFKQYGLDRGGNNELGASFKAYAAYLHGPGASRMAYNANLEGDYQKTLKQILQRINNNASYYTTQGQRGANRLSALYGRAQGLADQSARAQGLGAGAQLGTSQGLSQRAVRDASGVQEQWLNPNRQTQDMLQSAQLLEQAMQSNPYLNQMLQLFAPIEQRHIQNQSERGPGFLGQLAQGVIGNLAGGFGSSLGAGLGSHLANAWTTRSSPSGLGGGGGVMGGGYYYPEEDPEAWKKKDWKVTYPNPIYGWRP